MRLTGTTAMGIRLPIISKSDDLVSIVTDHVLAVYDEAKLAPKDSDIIAVTESMVAKAEGNFATLDDIAADVNAKFGDEEIGLVYPILSRNRFVNILKGIARGAKKVHVLLSYPNDEVGNPVMDIEKLDDVLDALGSKMVTADEFKNVAGMFKHIYTGVDYIDLYKSLSNNIEIYFSNDPRDILKITKHVLVAEIHNRFRTKKRLMKAGAQVVYTLSDILSESVNGSGYNPQYGILGSNLSTENQLKLFPAHAPEFVNNVQVRIFEKTGISPEVMVYGDGAFKDPLCGIWELADPVVSPGFTKRLGLQPVEIKMKYVADSLGQLSETEKHEAIEKVIAQKYDNPDAYREGTTPRIYADLVGSLCDLIGGSGDKGTPVVLLRGYFDDYTAE